MLSGVLCGERSVYAAGDLISSSLYFAVNRVD